jgi:rubrerythrin
MKNHSSKSTPSFVRGLVLICWVIAAAVTAGGCGKAEPPKEPIEKEKTLVTLENLQTAYAREMKQEHMYGLFSPRAAKEKYRGVGGLYRALQRSEHIHAAMHAGMMRGHGLEPAPVAFDSVVVGTTMQTVKMAISFEELEFGSMYPNLSRTAELENFQEGIDRFTMIHAVEERHLELLKEAQDNMGRIGEKYLVCPACGYIVTSEATEECPVCKAPKAKFEKI